MPAGRQMKTRSYQQQGTAAAQARAALTDAVKARLVAFSPEGVDLVGQVEAWIDAGIQLRDADSARAAIDGERSELERSLRVRWLRIVKALRHGADLSDLEESVRARVFSKLDEAIAAARR